MSLPWTPSHQRDPAALHRLRQHLHAVHPLVFGQRGDAARALRPDNPLGCTSIDKQRFGGEIVPVDCPLAGEGGVDHHRAAQLLRFALGGRRCVRRRRRADGTPRLRQGRSRDQRRETFTSGEDCAWWGNDIKNLGELTVPRNLRPKVLGTDAPGCWRLRVQGAGHSRCRVLGTHALRCYGTDGPGTPQGAGGFASRSLRSKGAGNLRPRVLGGFASRVLGIHGPKVLRRSTDVHRPFREAAAWRSFDSIRLVVVRSAAPARLFSLA